MIRIFLYKNDECYKQCKQIDPDFDLYGEDFKIIQDSIDKHKETLEVPTQEEADLCLFSTRNKMCWSTHYNTRKLWANIRAETSQILYPDKSAIIDYDDNPIRLMPDNAKFYFKRSTSDLVENKLVAYNRQVYHLPYCVRPDLEIAQEVNWANRPIDISILFPPIPRITRRNAIAFAVQQSNFLKQYKKQIGLVSQGGRSARQCLSEPYHRLLLNTKILINCNPEPWEGDMRLFEAMACGCCVMNDITPQLPNSVKNIAYYDRYSTEDVLTKAAYYASNPDISKDLAHKSLLETKASHQTTNRIDKILNVCLN